MHNLVRHRDEVGGERLPASNRDGSHHNDFNRRRGHAPASGTPTFPSSRHVPAAGGSRELAGSHRFPAG
jgi:hypothetical protein